MHVDPPSKYHIVKGRWKWQNYCICRKGLCTRLRCLESKRLFIYFFLTGRQLKKKQSRQIDCKITVGCLFEMKTFDPGELFLDRLNLTASKTLHSPISRILLPWGWHSWFDFVGSATCINYFWCLL